MKQRNIEVVLIATTTEHFSYEHEFRWTAEAQYDSAAMGKPISELAAVREIVLHFKQKVIPVGTVIESGELAMVVNNQLTVKFSIRGQTIKKVDQNNTVVVLDDVRKEMRKAVK
jgi:hypothetical protein